MSNAENNGGVDFFDFVYEVWVNKWIVALLMIACVAGAFVLPMMKPAPTTTIAAKNDHMVGRAFFVLDTTSDPHGRNASSLVLDLVGRVDPEAKLGIAFDGIVSEEKPIPATLLAEDASRYQFVFLNGQNYGYLKISIHNGGKDEMQKAYEAIKRASREQTEAAVRVASSTISTFSEMNAGTVKGMQLVPDSRIMTSVQFLAKNSPVDKGAAIIRLGALEDAMEEDSAKPVAVSSESSRMKLLFISVALGLLLSTLFIMFRIAISRNRPHQQV